MRSLKQLWQRAAARNRAARWAYVVVRTLVVRTLVVRPMSWAVRARDLRAAARRVNRGGRYRIRWDDPPWFIDPTAVAPHHFTAIFGDEQIPLSLSLERGYFDLDGFTHEAHYRRAAELARGLAASGPVRVLDCACGSGHGGSILSAIAGVDYTGVDLDENLVRYATLRYADHPGQYRHGDAADLGWLQEASVDLIVSVETVEHVDRDILYVREFQRILRPDGQLLLTTPERVGMRHSGNRWHPREYSKAALLDLFEGWRIETIESSSGTLLMIARPPAA